MRRSPKSGMVLLEIMVAMALFILVAFSLVQALDSILDIAKERWLIEKIILEMQNRLTLLHNTRLAPLEKKDTDEVNGILYIMKIEQYEPANVDNQPLSGMFKVTLRAEWKSDGQPDFREIIQIFYQQ